MQVLVDRVERLRVRNMGSGLGLYVPAQIATACGLKEGDEVALPSKFLRPAPKRA